MVIVALALLFSVMLGVTIAAVYVATLDVQAVPQPPFHEPTQVELDATAGLLTPGVGPPRRAF